MKIFYLPLSAKTVGDVLNIGAAVTSVMSRPKGLAIATRNYRAMRDEVSPSCEICGREPYHSIHHIRPQWVFGLEVVMVSPPESRNELYEMCKIASQGHLSLPPETHSPGNLIAVCRSCHGKEESAAYRYWKTHFLSRYDRLAWDMRSFVALARENLNAR